MTTTKKNKNNSPLLNSAGMERSVIAGIIQHGSDILIDLEDIISTKDFYWPINQTIFSILKKLAHNDNIKQFDIPTILAGSKYVDDKMFDDTQKRDYLESLFIEFPSVENTLSIAIAIYKLSFARQAYICMKEVQQDLLTVKGNEKIEDLISKIEDPIFQFTGNLTNIRNNLTPIAFNFEERLKAVSEEPKDIVGLPTGYPRWDQSIGGGLRRGSVNLIGARAKNAKSFICLNMAKNLAEMNIPVLYLDTELTQEIQMNRLISLVSEVDLEHIETGKFSQDQDTENKVWSCKDFITNLPITHCSIAGHSIESILSIARRWISKNVGLNNSGLTNPCLIIYDYLKLMDASDLKSNIQETQLLGFLITALHNFALKWSLPILATVQLNRDGIEEENSGVISGSDRLLWLCSNFTILKRKTQEELSQDPPKNGTRKLIVTDTRFGSGMNKGDYINIIDKLNQAKLYEGQLLSESVISSFINTKV